MVNQCDMPVPKTDDDVDTRLTICSYIQDCQVYFIIFIYILYSFCIFCLIQLDTMSM